MSEKAILRVADVLALLSISKPTLYRWMHNGLFPNRFQYGPRCVGWERKTVEDWIEAKRTAVPSAQ
jgi:prophage regulatory protein